MDGHGLSGTGTDSERNWNGTVRYGTVTVTFSAKNERFTVRTGQVILGCVCENLL